MIVINQTLALVKVSYCIFQRSVCSQRNSLTLPSMFTRLGIFESTTVIAAANCGISLSIVLNVQINFWLTVLCTLGKEMVKNPFASTILRATITISTKARCAWDSGSPVLQDTVKIITPTQTGIQCLGSLLKKLQKSWTKTFISA